MTQETPPQIKIAPSILSANFGQLNADIAKVEPYAQMLHIDVMDGHFVPNLTMGPVIIKHITSSLPLDVHLMIENPIDFIEPFAKAGATSITFHAQVVDNPHQVIQKIKDAGCKAAVALNPDKPLDLIKPYLDDIDMVLIMSVFPGFAGQKFMPEVLEKIKELRKVKPNLDIEIDGGINTDTIKQAVDAGANVIVAGSAIFCKDNPTQAIQDLKSQLE